LFDLDLDLDPMTLVFKIDLNVLKIYLHTKIKFIGQGFQTLECKQDRQAHRQTDAT